MNARSIIVAMISATSIAAADAQTRIEPQITTAVTLNDRIYSGQITPRDIESALDFAVASLKTTRPPPGEYVSSCRLWARALREGFTPVGDTVSIGRELEFEHACLPFLWLTHTRASRVSYLPAHTRWISDVRPFTTDEFEDWPWPNETRTISETNPDAPFQREPSSDPGPLGYTKTDIDADMRLDTPNGDYGWWTYWLEAARGDFNGDGIEDALILFAERGINNTSIGSSAVVVTRRSVDGPIEVLGNTPAVLAALSAN